MSCFGYALESLSFWVVTYPHSPESGPECNGEHDDLHEQRDGRHEHGGLPERDEHDCPDYDGHDRDGPGYDGRYDDGLQHWLKGQPSLG